MDFQDYMPDFFLPLFSALAVASRLGIKEHFDPLWACLKEADSRFGREWFKDAHHNEHNPEGWTPPAGLAPKFAIAVDSDFSNFIGWLESRDSDKAALGNPTRSLEDRRRRT